MKPYGIEHFDRSTVASGTDKFTAARRAAKKKARHSGAANDYECRVCGDVQAPCGCDVRDLQDERDNLRCGCSFCDPCWEAVDVERSHYSIKLHDFLKVG